MAIIFNGITPAQMLPRLTPAFVVDSPLPATVIADHVGALLAAAEADLTGGDLLSAVERPGATLMTLRLRRGAHEAIH